MKKIAFSVAISALALSCTKKETSTESNSMLAEPEVKAVVDTTQKHIVDQGNQVAKMDSTSVKPTAADTKKTTATENTGTTEVKTTETKTVETKTAVTTTPAPEKK